MPTWRALDEELGHWGEAGRTATFWWRDDDAGAATPELRRMIGLRRNLGVGLALAVVPAWLVPDAAGSIAAEVGVTVLQHGIAHADHARPGEKKCELVADRAPATVVADLRAAGDRLRARFGARALAVLVPPWNRIAGSVVDRLAEAGFQGLSRFGPRTGPCPVIQVNGHVDIVGWHHGRGFIGEGAALTAAIGHLRARREGAADRFEPTGLLSHHLVHDEPCWRFVERFIDATQRSPAARWLGADEVFAV